MRRGILLIAAAAVLLISACAKKAGHENTKAVLSAPCGRIVSMAPSITETIFALGLGNNTVGVTKFCKYPPEAEKIAKIGGYLDMNYEMLLKLKPDVVFLLPEHEPSSAKLSAYGIKTVALKPITVSGIRENIAIIGQYCGKPDESKQLTESYSALIKNVSDKTGALEKPKVLIVLDRDQNAAGIKDVFIAGKDQLYDEIAEIAGGRNAYSGSLKYPKISLEGILSMDPDVIIDLSEKAADNWGSVKLLKAVKNNRVYIHKTDYTVIPGPRFAKTANDFIKMIHPEVQ